MTAETITTKQRQSRNINQPPSVELTERDKTIDKIIDIPLTYSGLHEGQPGWQGSEEEELFKEDPYSNS